MLRFCRCYFVTMRPYLFFVSGAAGLLGLALSPQLSAPRFFVAAAVFYISYGLGQALTDVFQTDTDALSSPYRPLVQGLVTPRQVAAVSLAGLALCAVALAALNPATLALSALMVAGLVAYTPLKRRWWGGPPWNAAIMALLPCLAVVAARGPAVTSLLPATASVFFSYAVFVLLGYLKDVEADRASGYQTLPVRFGRKPAIVVSFFAALVAIACSARLLQPSPAGVALWLGGAAFLIAAHFVAWPATRDEQAHPAIALAVRGFVAIHLGEAVLARPSLALFAIVALALGEVALQARPSRAQI